jgi:hypothetical protein
MRIRVLGECDTAKAVRGLLSQAGYLLSDGRANYTVHLEEVPGASRIVFDSIDCELERRIFRHTRDLIGQPIAMQTAGGIQRDDEIRIVLPARGSERHAVELGILRGMLDLIPIAPSKRHPEKRWRATLAWGLLLFLLGCGTAFLAKAEETGQPEPAPIGLEERDAVKSLQLLAYKALVRLRDAEIESLKAQRDLADANRKIDEMAANIKVRLQAGEDWELTPEFVWRKKATPIVKVAAP